jgi:hypothetical protein
MFWYYVYRSCHNILDVANPTYITCNNVLIKDTYHKDNVATVALGSRPRQRGLQGCRPRGSPGGTPHAPGSVGKCEGMNPHTPKATPTLGNGVSWTPKFSEGDCRG